MAALDLAFFQILSLLLGMAKASVKGLQMGGVEIVSITDTTPTPFPGSGNRPRKARRL